MAKDKDKEKPRPVGLAELIQSAAEEIRTAQAQAPKDGGVMQFTGCEIEVSVKATVEGGGGVKFWIIDASAKAGAETSSKIKLSFGAAGAPKIFFAQIPGTAPPGYPPQGSPG